MNFFERNRTWQSKWLWAKGEPAAANSFYYFRAEFDYLGSSDVKLYITAESRYRLYLNGKYVTYGSLQSNKGCKYYDEINISSYLKEGKNCIGVIVNYVGNVPETRGGFLAEIVEDGRVIYASGKDSKVLRAEAYRQDTVYWRMALYNPYQEQFDMRKEPDGWTLCGYDDSGWEVPVVLHSHIGGTPPSVEPWIYLKQRDIPFCNETEKLPRAIVAEGEILDILNRFRSDDLTIKLSMPHQPKRYTYIENAESLLTRNGACLMRCSTEHLTDDPYFDGIYAPYLLLDMGEITVGFVELEVMAPQGASISIGYTERLIDGCFVNSIENPFADQFTTKEGIQTYRPFTWKAFRFLKIYVSNAFEPIEIRSCRVISAGYPLVAKGVFHSSDDKLNKLFDICTRTIRLCCSEFIVDTPWREQGQFLGDVSYVTLPALYTCFGEHTLPAKFLFQCGKAQNENGFIPSITNTNNAYILYDYNLHWINAVYEYYMYTGQVDILHFSYPIILKMMQSWLTFCDQDGLLQNVPAFFIDWMKMDKRGKSAVLNALFYHTLGNVVTICKLREDAFYADMFANAAGAIESAFHETFYHAEKGLYVDCICDREQSDLFSEQANVAAVLWGVCPQAYREDVLQKLYVEKETPYAEAQPFFSAVSLQALASVGQMDGALLLIRERWIKRMVDKGAETTYEEWTKNGSWRERDRFVSVMRTESHAWSAFPADFLVRFLSGIEILEAGCKAIRVNPYAADFDYEVTYPLPNGSEICVSCIDGKTSIHATGDVRIDQGS